MKNNLTVKELYDTETAMILVMNGCKFKLYPKDNLDNRIDWINLEQDYYDTEIYHIKFDDFIKLNNMCAKDLIHGTNEEFKYNDTMTNKLIHYRNNGNDSWYMYDEKNGWNCGIFYIVYLQATDEYFYNVIFDNSHKEIFIRNQDELVV